LIDNPRKLVNWTDKVWKAIENQEVFIGMNKEQVEFSLGFPSKVNRAAVGSLETEVWFYKLDSYKLVTFNQNGIVISFQT
jgi:outer membrane protein assembly factor BamE (lipoprotein component of BamABCDE complex)